MVFLQIFQFLLFVFFFASGYFQKLIAAYDLLSGIAGVTMLRQRSKMRKHVFGESFCPKCLKKKVGARFPNIET